MLLNKNSVKLILCNLDKVDIKWTDDLFIGYILNGLNGIAPSDSGLTRLNIINENHEINNDDVILNTHIRIKIRKFDYDAKYTNLVYEILKSQQ
jgi:hypothetical protein